MNWRTSQIAEIARVLNDRNVATPTGKPWSAMTVIRAREDNMSPIPDVSVWVGAGFGPRL